MATNKFRLKWLKLFPNYITGRSYKIAPKLFYCTSEECNEEASKITSSFVKFHKKEMEIQEKIKNPQEQKAEPTETFPYLLRRSKFIELGDPEGKEVIGEIYHVVGDDLYIDFGWKFPTVCTAPRNKNKYYVKGAKVRLQIKDLELSTKFLGSREETTLLEADCVLLGLARGQKIPFKNKPIKALDTVDDGDLEAVNKS